MAFFRKWKTHYKHKKFSSDETVDVEDWGLEQTMKNVPNLENMKLDLGSIVADGEEEEDDDGKSLSASYDIKYLGCTPIEMKRSEKQTSEAIKTVIANSKAGGRKNKTQKRVKLQITQDGIEVMDPSTQDILMKFSIYKISYCSVDAAHDHTFSFVGSEIDPLSQQERMSCHVFHCPKRKIAHEITLMVARCFENAYQQWRDAVVQQQQQPHVNNNNNNSNNANNNKQAMNFIDNGNSKMKKVLEEQQRNQRNATVEVHQPQKGADQTDKADEAIERMNDNLLIDFATSDNDVRKYLQNTWVSFEDEVRDSVRVAAC